MKRKISFLMMVLMCLLLTGCSNEFAEREYDMDAEIAKTTNRYAMDLWKFNTIDGGFTLTASGFNGRETLWSDIIEEDQDIEMEISFSFSEGRAKIVHIDEEGNVTTIIECLPETSTDGFVTKTVSLKSGENRLKIVGYDCDHLELEVLFEDPQ